MGALSQDARENIRLPSVTDGVLAESISFTQEYALRAPDAIHLSTAISTSQSVTEDTLYFMGGDARLNTAASNSGLTILNPELLGSLTTLNRLRVTYP
jgi:hypothetical protein